MLPAREFRLRFRLNGANVTSRLGLQDQWHRQPLKQPLQSLLRSIPIFHSAGSDPVQYISLPEGSFLAPAGCQPELLQQVRLCGHVDPVISPRMIFMSRACKALHQSASRLLFVLTAVCGYMRLQATRPGLGTGQPCLCHCLGIMSPST